MSALPPMSDICSASAHVRFGSKADMSAVQSPCPLHPRKRTLIDGLRRWSSLCQLPYWATNPPSIEMFAPVKKDARLEQSQTMSSATSSGVPIRPMG